MGDKNQLRASAYKKPFPLTNRETGEPRTTKDGLPLFRVELLVAKPGAEIPRLIKLNTTEVAGEFTPLGPVLLDGFEEHEWQKSLTETITYYRAQRVIFGEEKPS